jgi:uncharacterized protein (TIRG00374 family)
MALILGIVVSLGSLIWAFSLLNWGNFLKHLGSANWWVFIPFTVLMLFHYWLRTIRWRYLLPTQYRRVKSMVLFDSIMVGNLMTFILPFRAGEFGRPLLLSLEAKVPFATGFSSIVVERFFDLAAVLITFALIAYALPSIPDWAVLGAYSLSGLGVGIFFVLAVASFFPDRLLNFVSMLTKRIPFGEKISPILKELIDGLHPVRNFAGLATVVVLTGLVWVSNYFLFQIGFLLVGEHASFFVATAVAVILALAVAAPSAPGFIGVFQVACVAGFSIFGLSEDKGGAYAVLIHAHAYLVFVVLGFSALARYGVSLSSLRSTSSQ